MGRKSVSTGPRPPSGAGATSGTCKGGKGKKAGLRAGVHSLLSTFGGAILAAFVGYAIGYFTQNDKTSPGETVRRLLGCDWIDYVGADWNERMSTVHPK